MADGDYVAFVTAPGFRTGAVSFSIVSTAEASELRIVLDVGEVTQMITVARAAK